MEKITETLMHRAKNRIRQAAPVLKSLGVVRVYLAGGGLMRSFSDLDCYPADAVATWPARGDESDFWKDHPKAHVTKNSVSVGEVQVCRYRKDTLSELLRSFDFAHCQVGVELTFDAAKDQWEPVGANWTDDFLQAMATQTTWYTGSEYPLSSLVRIAKVTQKLGLTRIESARLTVSVLANVLDRGVKDHPDFLDQLDAIDLQLLGNLRGLETEATIIEHELLKPDKPVDDMPF